MKTMSGCCMPYILGCRSIKRLDGVHPDLVAVVKLAIQKTNVDFSVLEGVRSKSRQLELFRAGASRTMNSRHLDGHAVDLVAYVNGNVEWAWPLYDRIAVAMKQASAELGISIEWGGDWISFKKDGPHFQLSRKEYP